MLNNLPFLIFATTYPNVIFMKFISRRPRVKRANEIKRLEAATENKDYKYWLSQEDIADIARIQYSNYKTNDIFSEFEIIGSIENFERSINKFKINISGKETARFTLIINLGNRHWVTLVLFYQKNSNTCEGYYLNSNSGSKEVYKDEITHYKNALEKKFATIVWLDLSSFVTQQTDGYNCGFWVLENAYDINSMLKNKHSLDWLTERLNYQRSVGYFLEKRNYFSTLLRSDTERQTRLRSSLTDTEQSGLKKSELENKQAIEITPSVFERKNLKRPIKLEDSLPPINAKKLKSDKSIPIDDELFISIYREMTLNVISNLSKGSNSWATVSDLYNYLLIDAGQLTEEKLDNIIGKIGELGLGSTIIKLDKKNIIKQLQNINKIDKYLNVILYELDFGLCLMSLVNPSYIALFDESDVNIPYKKAESSYILKFLHHKQNINIDLSIFSTYLTGDFTIFDNHLLASLENKYNSLDKIEKTPSLFEGEIQEINEIYTLKTAIRYLLETPELRKLSQYLVYACLSNNKIDINNQLDLLQNFITRNPVPNYTSLLIFNASFKALILHNGKIDLNNFFEKFKASIPGGPSQLTNLFNKLSEINETIDEKLSEIEEEIAEEREKGEIVSPNVEAEIYLFLSKELAFLVKNLSSSHLLWLAGLSEKFEKETLDFIWNIYAIDLSDRNLLNDLLEVAFIRNSVEILEWCQEKFNDNNEFIEKIHVSWMSRRDWGKGPYIASLRQEKIKLAFELPKESEPTVIFTWIEENTETSKSDEVAFKRRELIFDLAARTRQKRYWRKPLLDLLSCNKEKVKKSYAYSRFAAEAVMNRDLKSLTEFWEEISKLEDEELKIVVQKKLLVDSTWAFHEGIRSGKKELIDFFLSKLESLPVERRLDYISYKYNLLRGLDPIQPEAKNMITNAVISRNVEVLQALFDNIKTLIQELEDIVASEMASSDAVQDAKNKLTDLKRNYYLEDNLDDTKQIDQFNRLVPDLIIALYLAAKTDNGRMVKRLLVTVKDKLGEQALKNLLLAVDEDGKTVLHWVASSGDAKVLKILLEEVSNFGEQTLMDLLLAKDTTGKTALHLTIFFGHPEVLASLLKAAVQANILKNLLLSSDINGVDPLRSAIMNGDTEIMRLLLQSVNNLGDAVKTDLLLGTNEAKETTLDLAVRIGNKKVVKILLETLESNFGLAVRNVYALKAKAYGTIENILLDECYLETGLGLSRSSHERRKRKSGENCEFSWEDVDAFNEEKEKPRDFSAVKISSDRFLDHIARQSMSDKKLAQLIQLSDTTQVTGNSQDRVSWLVKHQKALTHLNKVGQISGIAMQGMMAKNLLGDLIKDDYEGVAINLGFIVGGQGFAKVAEIANAKGLKTIFNGQPILGQSLRFSSPFLQRVTSAFVGYDLVNQIKEYKKDNPDALVGMVGDSIYLSVDVAEIGIETVEVFSLLEGVSSVTGPIGASIGAIVFVGTDIYFATKHVYDIDKQIHLTSTEKFIEGLFDFLHLPQKYIQTLVEEKQANNELAIQAMKIFEQNKEIKKYIFPSASIVNFCITYKHLCRKKRIVAIQKRCREEEKVCSVKKAVQKDNVMLFDIKKSDIKLSRTKPDNLDKGSFFCLPAANNEPIFQNDIYYCENAIGIEYPYNRTANDVLISLGAGNDRVIGFPNENHHILLGNGRKNIILGEGNNTFILQDNPTGVLRGGSGSNILDLGSYAQESQVICVYPSKVHDCHTSKQTEFNSLEFSGINTLLLRKSKQDWVWADCNMRYIDTRGGKKEPETDIIFIDTPDDFSCLYDIKFIVRPYTNINYCGGSGNFSYIIPAENKGASTIFLLVTNNSARHEFIFNHTLYDINAIKKIGSTTINFDFVKAGNSSNITDDKFFFSIIGVPSKNIFYRLSDNTEIKVGNDSFYALQSTDKPVENIIKDYSKIANKLKMYIFVTFPLKNETIAIGHGNYDVLYNNPYYKSHLIGNGGENIFLVTSGYEILDKRHLPIPEIILYDVDDENLIDTLDLTEIRKQLEKDLGLKIKARTNLVDNDVLINLFSTDEAEYVLVTVRLKDALLTNWHKRLHVILNHVPMELEGLDLKPLPLQFSQDKEIVVIFPEDIGEENKLIFAKKSGNYYFARSENNLVITNAFDSNITTSEQRFTLLLIQFYQMPKMETLSIKFADKEVFIKSEMQRITNATSLEAKIARYKQACYSVLFNYTTKFQRNRRSIPREKKNVANLAISLSNPISNVVRWLKEKSSTLVSSIIPEFYQRSPEKPTPIYKQQTLQHLEDSKSYSEKKNNRSFTRDYDYNWTDSIYLLKYVLHYLGWGSFVNRVNQAERLLAYPNAYMNPLDLVEQRVKKVMVSYEVIYSHDSNKKAVLYQGRSGSTVGPDSTFPTKPTGNRVTFFPQSQESKFYVLNLPPKVGKTH